MEEALKLAGCKYRVLDPEPLHRRNRSYIKRYIQSNNIGSGYHLAKGHWYSRSERKILLGDRRIKVFLIWRNIYDAMVSSYFYKMNKHNVQFGNYEEFYWKNIGRYLYIQQLLYRHSYRTEDAVNINYEELLNNFSREVHAMLNAAEIQDLDLSTLQERVNINRLKLEKRDSKGVFFRSGKADEYLEFDFGDKALSDMKKLCNMSRDRLNILLSIECTKHYHRYLYNRLGDT